MKQFRSANQVLVSKRLDVWRAPMPFAEAGEQDISESVRPVARCYNVPLVAKSALSPLIGTDMLAKRRSFRKHLISRRLSTGMRLRIIDIG